jgi:dolichol-phosphate mannosyltransferase
MMPAYNEEEDLPLLLDRVHSAMNSTGDYRIIVVDDGSEDRTREIAESAAQRMPLTLIRHPRNLGLGAAMRTGLLEASTGDGVVVTLDADNSQDPELIPSMVRRIEDGFDVVIASRFQPGSKEIGVPPIRLFLSHVSSAGIRVLAPYKGVRDYTCGFRAYRTDAIRGLIRVLGPTGFIRENGFSCMLELLLNLRANGARASEVPLVLRYDMKVGASKMKIFRTMWRYVVTLSRGFVPISLRSAQGPLA